MAYRAPAIKQAQRFARQPVESWPGYDEERALELADERWADEQPADELPGDQEDSADA